MTLFKKKKVENQQVEMPVIFFTLHTLLLNDFIEIVCEKKLHKIVKQGVSRETEIIEAWDNLFLSYCDIVGNTEYEGTIEDRKQLLVLEAKINLVKDAIVLLMLIYVKDLATFLNDEYGFIVEYYEDEKTYHKQFFRIEAKLKKWKVDYDLMLMQQPKENEEKITVETFDTLMIVLSEFMGYPVRAHETTVSQFAIMQQRLRHHNNLIEQRNKKVA